MTKVQNYVSMIYYHSASKLIYWNHSNNNCKKIFQGVPESKEVKELTLGEVRLGQFGNIKTYIFINKTTNHIRSIAKIN